MTRQLNSLADLGAQLDGLGFGPSYLKNVRGAFGKAPKHYGDALIRVPADLAEFDRRWGRGRVRRHPPSFRSADEFKTWRKLIRSALMRGHDVKPGSVIASDWAILAAFVRENQGRGKLLGWNAHLTFEALARAASKVGLAPCALDQPGIDMLVIDLGTSERKSALRGIARLNALTAARDTLPMDICQCLPAEFVPEPTPLIRHTSPWARSSKDPIGAAIWAEFDRIMQIKRFGAEGPVIVGTPSAFSENSVTAYQNAVSWLLGELWQLDLLDPGCGLKDALTHGNMIAATNAWISRRQQRGLPTDTSSLHGWISKLTHLAINYLDVPPREVERMRDLREKPAIRTKSVGQMSRVRLKWIMEFDRNVAMQRRVERLPETLMALAEKILDRQRCGGRTSPTEAMQALKLGVGSAQTAILFRASPIRSGNLRHLRFRGAGAEFPLDALNDREGALRLMIPGERVKNGEDIDEIADYDLAPVLRWYLAEIRPRLISDHPFTKNYCDSDYLFPSPTERPMEETSFREMFKDSCAQIGLDFEMHQARHITAYWILIVDPRAWGEAAAVLHIDEMTVRKYYGWMSTRRASEAGRQKLLEQRRSFRRHANGDFDE